MTSVTTLASGAFHAGIREREREDITLEQGIARDRVLADGERRALRIAQLSVRNPDDALDIVQDAMISLAQKYGRNSPDEWRPLFYRILQKRIREHHRRETVRRRTFAWFKSSGDSDYDPVHARADGSDAAIDTGVFVGRLT